VRPKVLTAWVQQPIHTALRAIRSSSSSFTLPTIEGTFVYYNNPHLTHTFH
jgi:hypothetical protein